MQSDRELVEQLQAGSLDALGALYDRHQEMVFRTALAITGDRCAAADLLQEVFLRLHRYADRIDPQRPLEPWLYRMTTNLTYTWVKRHQRFFQPLESLVEWFSGTKKETWMDAVEEDEAWQDVRQAVARLPLAQRTVVVLYYLNDLSLNEIAEILELPLGTVKSRLHYGRKALRQYLEPADVEIRQAQYEFT